MARHECVHRDGNKVFRIYFINNRGDEQMGSTWNYLDITALGYQEEGEDSPKGYPRTPPYKWWIWHDEYAETQPHQWWSDRNENDRDPPTPDHGAPVRRAERRSNRRCKPRLRDKLSVRQLKSVSRTCFLVRRSIEEGKEKIIGPNGIVAIVRAAYESYVAKNRAVIEKLIATDFHFTSPLDNRIDRATYFARCWPNSERIDGFHFINLVPDRDRVFVTYEGHTKYGERFRNTEIVTVRDGQIVEVEVYFGWSIPHKAKLGGFVESDEA